MPRYLSLPLAKNRKNDEIVYYSGLPVLFQFVRYHVGATGTGEHEIAGSVAAAGAGANPRAIAKGVGYNGTNMKIVIWMEGTDSDCQNWSEQDKNTAAPTFDVTVSLVGIVPDSK